MNSIFDELRSAVYSVWHRHWVVLGVAWAVCLLGWLVVAMIPNSYESKARIFVHLDDPLAEQIGVGVNDRKRDVTRVRQTLTGAINLEKVVRSTRLGDGVTTPKQMEAVIQSLAKKIKVESEQDNLFKISATASNGSLSEAETAKLAQDIVQKLIDIFREENLAGGNGEMGSTIEFMDQQLAQRQKALEEAERKRTEFEARFPELAQGGASVLQRLEAGRSELRGIDADLAAAQSALAAINGQIAGTPQTLPGYGAAGGAKGALAEAQGQLAGMRARGLKGLDLATLGGLPIPAELIPPKRVPRKVSRVEPQIEPEVQASTAEPEPKPVRFERIDDEPQAPALAPRQAEPAAIAVEAVKFNGPRHKVNRDLLRQQGMIQPEGGVSGLLEEFRIVKRQLLLHAKELARGGMGAAAQRILVCSPLPGEGKTYTSVNLALSIAAEKESEVLLVDADFAKPSVLSTLGLPGGKGLMDVTGPH